MSSFVLKIIAIVFMFCDHFGDFYYGKITVLNYIGRIAFPIFAFQIAQGYIHTKDIKKYIFRLTIFALISQIPYMLFQHAVFGNWFEVNVIFTLLFGLLAILTYDKYNKFVGICSCIFLGTLAQVLHFDYGFFGVYIVFMFYLLRNHKLFTSMVYLLSTITMYTIRLIKNNISLKYLFLEKSILLLVISSCLAIIPILFFNEKKGKDVKYLFYIFYPTHLLILGLLKLLVLK